MGFGINHVQNAFKRMKAIIPATFASTTANSVSIISSSDYTGANLDITIYGVSDGVYVTPLSTAPTSTNAFLINADVSIDFKLEDKLYLTSPSTVASYQAIIWEG